MIKDSGNRTKFESGAVRDIQEGKGRCDLLPLHVISTWLGDSIFGMIEQYRNKSAYDPTPRSTRMVQILDAFADKHRNTVDTCKSRERYRYDLVLEVAKHFEDGAKKYGDRNWEKGIPCDRYIDSAVRHYCKWRAGWDDEPHDRAFIWNILCCEWTRQRYGWNLERLGEKGDETAIKEFIDKIGTGDFAEKAHKLCDPVIPILTGLLHYDRLMSGSLEKTASDWKNETRFTRCACRYLYDKYGHAAGRVWILDAEKSADLTPAINYTWMNNNGATPKMLESRLVEQGWKPGVDFIVEAFDEESESKKFEKIGEQMSQALKDCEVWHNPYVKDTDDGWRFYDVNGYLIGYIFKFKEPEEGKRRQLGRIIHKVWHEVTDNPYTIKRIVEEWGYVCGKDFSICIAPSEVAKEYDLRNRKYNEED